MASSRARARAVARVHFGLGARLGLDWLHGAIEQLPASGSWQRTATAARCATALAAHLRISAAALRTIARTQRGDRRCNVNAGERSGTGALAADAA
jgi:NAD-specific glutamate dehydrogenase